MCCGGFLKWLVSESLIPPCAAHLPWAHHNVLNRRDDEKAGYMKMSPRVPHNSHTGSDTVSTAGESIRPRIGDIQDRAFEFNPPSMIRWYTVNKDQVGGFDPCYVGARTICYLRSRKQRVHDCACSDARATTSH